VLTEVVDDVPDHVERDYEESYDENETVENQKKNKEVIARYNIVLLLHIATISCLLCSS